MHFYPQPTWFYWVMALDLLCLLALAVWGYWSADEDNWSHRVVAWVWRVVRGIPGAVERIPRSRQEFAVLVEWARDRG